MIVLIGFMGSGKTTVARMLAARLGTAYVDTDAGVERLEGRSISEIFGSDGEERFRELERAAIASSLSGPAAVVSLGGGAVADATVRELLSPHTCVFLDVAVEEAVRRAQADGDHRPLLDREDPGELYRRRREWYESLARIVVDTTDLRPEEVASEIAARIEGPGDPGEATRRIRVETVGASYWITIGAGLLGDFSEQVPPFDAGQAWLITHPGLLEHAAPLRASLEAAGLDIHVLELAEGERSKTLAGAAELYGRLARERARRHDPVITFGGGVVSDVGGFVASTYMRGMPLIHVPTTLLAQVDAAVGGKTGVNLDAGKNLVGTIYQPRAVLCDVELLRTCPPEEIRSGLAEVVKYGFIADPSLIDFVVSNRDRIQALDAALMTEIVTRSVAVKASIVATDEREAGDRAYLNYGHTFGHAIETVLGFGGIRHGEAVSLGMMAAAYTAAELGWIDESVVALHRSVLSGLGLPTSGRFDFTDLSKAWEHDKKFVDQARFVLLRGLGQPEAGVSVEPDVLRAALTRLARED